MPSTSAARASQLFQMPVMVPGPVLMDPYPDMAFGPIRLPEGRNGLVCVPPPNPLEGKSAEEVLAAILGPNHGAVALERYRKAQPHFCMDEPVMHKSVREYLDEIREHEPYAQWEAPRMERELLPIVHQMERQRQAREIETKLVASVTVTEPVATTAATSGAIPTTSAATSAPSAGPSSHAISSSVPSGSATTIRKATKRKTNELSRLDSMISLVAQHSESEASDHEQIPHSGQPPRKRLRRGCGEEVLDWRDDMVDLENAPESPTTSSPVRPIAGSSRIAASASSSKSRTMPTTTSVGVATHPTSRAGPPTTRSGLISVPVATQGLKIDRKGKGKARGL